MDTVAPDLISSACRYSSPTEDCHSPQPAHKKWIRTAYEGRRQPYWAHVPYPEIRRISTLPESQYPPTTRQSFKITPWPLLGLPRYTSAAKLPSRRPSTGRVSVPLASPLVLPRPGDGAQSWGTGQAALEAATSSRSRMRTATVALRRASQLLVIRPARILRRAARTWSPATRSPVVWRLMPAQIPVRSSDSASPQAPDSQWAFDVDSRWLFQHALPHISPTRAA